MCDTLEARVVALIAKKKKMAPERLTTETRLADIGIDSLDAMDLMFDFEDAFKINIPDEVAQQMTTVGEVIAALRKVLGGRAAEAG
jgi:acyl carrier protein